ncbi:NAD-dependent epimerase/dehydratase family protein [Streptomyces sp. BI20]|uniref:NAD-dependent epimerase/dehydratase family protein n=1 Tax=Streptomyces sp. BI20 TaxID=3403460 RepID=UPI003C71B930
MTAKNEGRRLVVTGAGGLVGAELTASLLGGFDRVLVLTPGPAEPERVRSRIARVLTAQAGVGAEEDTVAAGVAAARAVARIEVRSTAGLTRAELVATGFDRVAQVWNVGASLSYDKDRLTETVDANTTEVLRLLELCPPEERFFHVSTVGVTGPGLPGRRETVFEEPVWTPDAVNPYVVSKLLTEHMLDHLRLREGTPVTMLRLGSVIGPVGHAPVQANRAGYYTLVEMLAKVRARGATLSLDVDPATAPPLAHVDQLARACAALSVRARAGAEVAPYYHLGDQSLGNGDAVAAVNEAVGAELLRLGPATTALDRAYASVNADNIGFMNCGFVFDHAVLDAHVPREARPRVTAESYAGFVLGQLERLASGAARRTPGRVRTGAAR